MTEIYADTLCFLGGSMGPAEFDPEVLNRIQESRVRLVQWGGPHPFPENGWPDLIKEVAATRAKFGNRTHVFRVVLTRESLDRIRNTRHIYVVMTVQNPYCIGKEWGRVGELWNQGVRVIQLAYWNHSDALYGSPFFAKEDCGLTTTGITYLAELAGYGFILDLSHLGPRTALEAADAYPGKIMISHTGARAIYDYPRSAKDDIIKIIAERGGIVGVYTLTFFLDPKDNGVTPWLSHIAHIIEIAGAEHVTIGSDAPVAGFLNNNAAKESFERLTAALSRGRPIEQRFAPRWPAFIPDFIGVDRFAVMERVLSERFGPEVARGIVGENALKFYRDALPLQS